MFNVLPRVVVLAAALAAPMVSEPAARARAGRSEKLSLKSGYSGKVLVEGARRVVLSVTLDEKGCGSGTLAFDPNIYDGDTATQAAIRECRVRVRPVRDEEPAAKGRRLYEISETGLDPGMADVLVPEAGGRWFLVRPLKEGMPCWLVFANEDGKFADALMLQ